MYNYAIKMCTDGHDDVTTDDNDDKLDDADQDDDDDDGEDGCFG